LPLPGDEAVAYAGLSKCDLFRRCDQAGLGHALAPHRLLSRGQPLPSARDLGELGTPLFVKADAVHALDGGGSVVLRCTDADAALGKVAALHETHAEVLVQGYVPGAGVGAFLADWEGHRLAEFMHRRLHEVPHTGGASSYRRSWRDDRILADARARMQCLGWQGVGMFEYRWHPVTGRFRLIEFNSRFWGSLHLALYAGVDFPHLLADAFFGQRAPPQTSFEDVRARLTFPAEVAYVLSCLRDSDLDWARRTWPVIEFFALGLNPRVRSDMMFPGDRGLYLRSMLRSFAKFLQ
jgi:predicted ATP-grasp superfamily ATP-dependent carboligase